MPVDESKYTGDPKSHDISKFKEELSATCLCGKIRVTIKDNELFTKKRGHLCHCSNCRKVAGSYVSSNLAIDEGKVTVDDPEGVLKIYEDYATGSGKCVRRHFCTNCGNPIMSKAEMLPGTIIVKMGMFPRIPEPEAESFALHRQSWQGKHEGMPQFRIVRGGEKLEGSP